ncbi:MAG: hypothetical protein OJF61_000399 [Rhodanobacteraceae bacterium]|jgi:hypothetical protein|nr:MAG: hypothetical protein OJF61_000399 [Rhodanobacteraceae bacterium]
MQLIPIIWPILACAFVTGVLLGWVLFVALPRMRRAEKYAARMPRFLRRAADAPLRPAKTTLVDADQQAIPRNM